jgi:hypothetical protein
MNGLKSTATLPRRAVPHPVGSVSPASNGNGGADQRQLLLAKAERLNHQARQSAELGDIEASARLILEALDCERRAGGLGPQVLQLIKPRG